MARFGSALLGYRSFTRTDQQKEDAEQAAEQTVAQLLEALQQDDKAAAEDLFAANMRASLADFSQSLDELFAYFDGEVQSISRTGFFGVMGGQDWGDNTLSTRMSYDITTTDGGYRMVFRLVCLDTKTPENEGLWSFSIIRAEDDPCPDTAYEGDGTYPVGIHVGAVCAPVTAGNDALAEELSLQAVYDLLTALREGETEAAAALFAPNAKAAAKNFPQELESLRTLFGSDEVGLTLESRITVNYGLHANNQYQEHGVFTYRAETPHGIYLLALKQTYYDTTVPEDIGLWSLYVFPLTDTAEAPTLPETEDDYAPGIHIAEESK